VENRKEANVCIYKIDANKKGSGKGAFSGNYFSGDDITACLNFIKVCSAC
jgi:hypothetical protein